MRVRHSIKGAFACTTLVAMANAISIMPAMSVNFPITKNQMVSCYKAADYISAAKIGQKLVARDPADYDARYYLANSLVMAHRNDEAIDQYRLCLHNSKSESVKAYSGIALERLLKLKEKSLLAMTAAGAAAKNKEMQDFEKKVSNEARNEQMRVQKEWNQALASLSMRQNSQANGSGRGFGSGYDWSRRLRQDNDSYYRERQQIDQTYSRRISDIAQYKEAMLTQTNCGTGKIRLAPSLSSSRVKNYVNYGDESEAANIPIDNPLHAQAKALDPPTVAHKPAKGAH